MALAACGTPNGSTPMGGGSGASSPAGGSSGSTSSAGGVGGMSGVGGTAPADCSQPAASNVRLAALSESQFNNSVSDLLKVTGSPANGQGEAFDDVSLEQRAAVAASVATQAAASLSTWAPCAPPASGTTTACEQQIIDKVGAKLYRRPLSDVERADMTKLFDAGVKEKDFATGVEWFLTGLLQSPYFVYQVVRPDPTEKVGAVQNLGPYEYASRLSYFIWDGPPDDALTAAAASGDLADPAKRDAQVSRLLQDARFSRGVTQFYTRWLKIPAFREVARNLEENSAATLDDSVVTALAQSLLMSATELYKDPNPNISSLFTGDSYYFNDVLRKFYGLDGTGTDFTKASMGGQGRLGILTHPGLMALLARPNETFPIGRGLFLLRNIICQIVPAPPPGFVIPEQPPQQEGTSTRERLEKHTADAFCQGCHSMINPAGFAFESFDQVGRYRTVDHGRPVDTSGKLSLGKDVDGAFANGDELLAKLADSQAVRACFAEKYLDFALSHAVTDPADTCSIQALGKSFGATGDLKQLVVAVATSDSFRMRLAEGVGQ